MSNLKKLAQQIRNKVDLSRAEFNEDAQVWRLKDPLGYVRLYKDKPTPRNYFKYDYEHRRVLAEALGRELLRQEIIHHLDGDKANNVKENLQLLANHLEHMKLHPEWRQKRTMPASAGTDTTDVKAVSADVTDADIKAVGTEIREALKAD